MLNFGFVVIFGVGYGGGDGGDDCDGGEMIVVVTRSIIHQKFSK